MNDSRFDVAIVGAGPAGAIAANALARKGRNVLLLDRAPFPRRVTCSGWVSAKVEPLLKDTGVRGKSLLSRPFTNVRLINADFTKTASPTFAQPPGYLVDRTEFDKRLVDSAVEHGAVFVPSCTVNAIKLRESSVNLTGSDGKAFESRLLLIAAGRGTPLLDSVGFPRQQGGTPMWSAQVADPGPASSDSEEPRISVVLGLDGGGSFGFCCVAPNRVNVDINWLGEKRDVPAALARLCKLAFEKGVVPVDLSSKAASADLLRTPAAAALDMESHVRKHTLLIGDAGGFLSAVSNEGIYPAMWSARIAAGVISDALDSRHSQDTLISFDSRWRMEMADHLRSPHTDIRFLLPLIFSNQPMADRMGAAFFLGDNI
jgi:menaquinone-9 beta-reductase